MTQPYTPPGVIVEELVSPTVTPVLAVPGTVMLVGMGTGSPSKVYTDVVTLNGSTPSVLPQLPTDATNVSFVDATTGLSTVFDYTNAALTASAGYSDTTDFTYNPTTQSVTRSVTSQTLGVSATLHATSVTLSSGAVPAVGQIIRLTGPGPTFATEVQTVTGVVGQVVTFANGQLARAYNSTGSTVTWGHIPDGDQVAFGYTYLPSDYWQPVRLTNLNDVQNRFGAATVTDASGATVINSRLSFAAQCAFDNGASSLILQPFYVIDNTGLPVAPVDTDAAVAANWSTVLNGVIGLEGIDIVVPVVGQGDNAANTDSVQSSIFASFQDYIYTQRTQNDELCFTFLGEDQTTSTTGTPKAQEATIQAHAVTLAARYGNAVTQQMVMVNTASFIRAGNFATTFNVGGQYMAAAIAGMVSSRIPSATVTRQAVAGFVAVNDVRTKQQKNADAANGLLVVESKGNIVQVRHGITMDLTSVATRELNVVHAKTYLITSVRQTLDTQIIGKIAADANATTTVDNVVIGVLEDLRGLGYISSYGAVESTIVSIDPTAMEVRFAYQPTFYVNYITVIFSLDLTAQNLTLLTPA